ncbi:N5-carboxyaminoimidazole ribonucleotide mutase [uncultured archaeon]|nr:N5-carboxyaminoimidazole ribonucleotide mutase [uncultured archaeon]
MVEVAIIIGSESDMMLAEKAVAVLDAIGISHSLDVASAHRSPEKLDDVVNNSQAQIFIAIAGLAAALPGVIASKTVRPVIGVPVDVKLEGLDAFLSMAQMPAGVPIAVVGIDNAKNAAILAAEILSLTNSDYAEKLVEYRNCSKKK